MRDKINRLIQDAIDQSIIPGAIISVSYNNKIIFEKKFGNRTLYPIKSPMKLNTIFDVASLTKVVATLPAILKLMDDKIINLTDPISLYIPILGQRGKDEIQIKHLLSHTSGLPAEKKFYLSNLHENEIINSIISEPLIDKVGRSVIYSDLGFILLYKVIEEASSMDFQQFIKNNIFIPLEMEETTFLPSFDSTRYASTEFCNILNQYKHGIVHDNNALSMGGVSGHAGLFTTIKDLQNYSTFIENKGFFKSNQIISENLFLIARKNYSPNNKEHRGLGWILNSSEQQPCGNLFSDSSYGHTGFTGTSIWFDPENNINVILLTNSIHLRRSNEINKIRINLHNLIFCELKKEVENWN